MIRPVEAVARWLRARRRQVEVAAHDEAADPTPFKPIQPCLLRISRAGHRPRLLHLATRATAIWSPRERCWVLNISGAELDGFLTVAACQGGRAHFAILALGGADRIVPKAPPPPSGLFVARATAIEHTAIRTFGSARDRRLLLRVDAHPWRHLADLDPLVAP